MSNKKPSMCLTWYLHRAMYRSVILTGIAGVVITFAPATVHVSA